MPSLGRTFSFFLSLTTDTTAAPPCWSARTTHCSRETVAFCEAVSYRPSFCCPPASTKYWPPVGPVSDHTICA